MAKISAEGIPEAMLQALRGRAREIGRASCRERVFILV